MRPLTAILLCFGITAGSLGAEAPLHVHLLGHAALAARKDVGKLKDIAALPDSKKIGNFLARGLADAVLPDFTGPQATGDAAILSGLFEQATRTEFAIEVTDRKKSTWRAVFPIPGAERANWMQTLRAFSKKQGGKIKSPVDAHGSWLLTPKGTERSVLVSIHGDWVMLDATGEAQPSSWRRQAEKTGRPVPPLEGLGKIRCASHYLEPLAPGLRLPHAFNLNLNLTAQKQRIRTEGTVEFSDPVNPPMEPFSIPTNTIRDPLITFSAVRGFRDWLAGWKELPQWRTPSLPNQAFGWALQDIPMHTLLAFPLPNAADYLSKQTLRVKESLNPELAKRGLGEIAFDETSGAQALSGLMFLAPFMAPAPETSGNWALAGSIIGNRPVGASTNPPPAELLEQVRNRPNLLYYHWEITQPRLEQLTMLISFIRVVALRFNAAGENPFPQWLMSIRPFLGNTVTEINRESEQSWSITRTSDLGLTAMELALLGQRFAKQAPLPSLPGPPTN